MEQRLQLKWFLYVSAVEAFAARLRDAVDLDAVRSDLLSAVNAAVEPAHISVWTAPAARRQ